MSDTACHLFCRKLMSTFEFPNQMWEKKGSEIKQNE